MPLIQASSPCLPAKVPFVSSIRVVGNNFAGDPSTLATDVDVSPVVGFVVAATVSLVVPLVTERAAPSPAVGASSPPAADPAGSTAAAAPNGVALSSAK